MKESAFLPSLLTLVPVAAFLAHTGGYITPILNTLSQNGF